MSSKVARIFQAFRSLLGVGSARPRPARLTGQAPAAASARDDVQPKADQQPEPARDSSDRLQHLSSSASPSSSHPPLPPPPPTSCTPSPVPRQETSSPRIVARSEPPSAAQLKTIKPHIPMIRFRKGGSPLPSATPVSGAAVQSTPAAVATAAVPPAPAKASPWTPTTVASLEWYETPQKFRKRPIDEAECDMINMGGADKIYS